MLRDSVLTFIAAAVLTARASKRKIAENVERLKRARKSGGLVLHQSFTTTACVPRTASPRLRIAPPFYAALLCVWVVQMRVCEITCFARYRKSNHHALACALPRE